jgi:hypothetical protein
MLMLNRKKQCAGHLCLTPIILVAQEDHHLKPARSNSLRDPILKKPITQKNAGRVAQGVGLECKS